MKKIFYVIIGAAFLASCGPHRMSCGPRGICETPEPVPVEKQA